MKYLFLLIILISCSSKPIPKEEPAKDLIYTELDEENKIVINNCVLRMIEDDWDAYIDLGVDPIRKGAYSQPDEKLKPKVLSARNQCLEQLKNVKEYQKTFNY